jgi:outer membrane protein with beta-barrel domain
MQRVVLLASLLLILPPSASAEPGVGFFATYTIANLDFSDVHLSAGGRLKGWCAGIDVPISAMFGVVGRIGGEYGDTFKTGAIFVPLGTIERTLTYDVVGGPRIARRAGRFSPWADAVVGVMHVTARSMAIDAFAPVTGNAFTAGAGGGLDVRVARHVDVRVVDFQYRRASIFDQVLNRTSVSLGVVWRGAGS